MSRKHKRTDRKRSAKNTTGSQLRIAVATSAIQTSGGVSLDEEIRLLKPALLYADAVTLYSPAAMMLFVIGGAAQLNAQQRMKFMLDIYPMFEPERAPILLGLLDRYKTLASRNRGRTREELLEYVRMKTEMDRLNQHLETVWETELIPKIEETLESAGASQLVGAIASGLLEVDPLLQVQDDFSTDQLIDAFVTKLAALLQKRGAYPLFDDQTGTLVRHGINEGLFTTSPLTQERGKQVAAASTFMSRLPALSAATIPEILDIRNELRSPLIRFRSAMIELGTLIESSVYEESFSDEVDELFRAKVEPAMLEIKGQIESSRYLQELIGVSIGDTKTLLAGILALGITQSADMPNLIAGGAAVAQVSATAAWKRHVHRRNASQHELYFLYRTQELLIDRT